jgi:hypothetical protein
MYDLDFGIESPMRPLEAEREASYCTDISHGPSDY